MTDTVPKVMNFDNLLPEPFEFSYHGVGYVLKPGTGAHMKQYNAARLKGVKMVGDEVRASLEGKEDLPARLIAHCTFTKDEDKGVSLAQVQEWPEIMLNTLYAKARKLCGLDEESPVRNQFGKLVRADVLEEWREAVKERDDLKELAEWLEPTTEELAKNVPDTSENGSD